MPDAARIAVGTTAAFLKDAPSIAAVTFACFGRDVLDAFQGALDAIAAGTG